MNIRLGVITIKPFTKRLIKIQKRKKEKIFELKKKKRKKLLPKGTILLWWFWVERSGTNGGKGERSGGTVGCKLVSLSRKK